MNDDQIRELLLQSLEHEMGGVKLYEAALECAESDDLMHEWEKYLEQTRRHVEVLQETIAVLGLDADEETPGRAIVAALGAALLEAVNQAREGDSAAAQIVAAECVVLAETRDHFNWELIGQVAGKLKGKDREALQAAYDEVEDQEDEHLYHTRGWCRELWLESLGLKAVLPPPEETKHVKTAIGAARVQQSRGRS